MVSPLIGMLAKAKSQVKSQPGKLPGRVTTGVGLTAGFTEQSSGRALDQSINIATGNINPSQIIKNLVIFAVICMILIGVIGLARYAVLSIEALGCNYGNTICGVTHNCQDCDIASPTNNLSSNFAFWQFEWFIRCILYIAIALIVLVLAYVWGKWLMDKLLRIDKYIALMDNWIFGTQFEGEAERQIEQRL